MDELRPLEDLVDVAAAPRREQFDAAREALPHARLGALPRLLRSARRGASAHVRCGAVRDVTKSAASGGEGLGESYDLEVTCDGEDKAAPPTVVRAAKVVFAIGAAKPIVPKPSWTTRSRLPAPRELVEAATAERARDTVLVVGGGLSAAQAALLAVRRGAGRVVLCSRRPIRTQQYDLPLEWMNPRSVAAAKLDRARACSSSTGPRTTSAPRGSGARAGRATVPAEYVQQLAGGARRKAPARHGRGRDRVARAARRRVCEALRVTFAGGASALTARVILGTGSELDCAGLEMMRGVVEDASALPTVGGLPVLSDALQWGDERFAVVARSRASRSVPTRATSCSRGARRRLRGRARRFRPPRASGQRALQPLRRARRATAKTTERRERRRRERVKALKRARYTLPHRRVRRRDGAYGIPSRAAAFRAHQQHGALLRGARIATRRWLGR